MSLLPTSRKVSGSSSTGPSQDPCTSKRLDFFFFAFTSPTLVIFLLIFYLLEASGLYLFQYLLLSETQLSNNVFINPFHNSKYNLYSQLCFKGGIFAYSIINMSVAQLMDFESPDFDIS